MAWEEKDKARAVVVFKSLGSIAETADITGIPLKTLQAWRNEEWWNEKLLAYKAADTAKLEEAALEIARLSGDIVVDRLRHGDYVLNKDGDLVRKPVAARDAVISMAVAIDKRKVLQQEPERDTQLGSAERLLKLVEQFAKFASAKEIKGVLSTPPKEIKDAEFTELQTELQAGSLHGESTEERISELAERSAEAGDQEGDGATK